MRRNITTKKVTFLNYSLSKEEKEILAKSSDILDQVFDTLEECTDSDLSDQQELVEYFNNILNEDVVSNCYPLCGIIDAIVNNSDTNFIVQEEFY